MAVHSQRGGTGTGRHRAPDARRRWLRWGPVLWSLGLVALSTALVVWLTWAPTWMLHNP